MAKVSAEKGITLQRKIYIRRAVFFLLLLGLVYLLWSFATANSIRPVVYFASSRPSPSAKCQITFQKYTSSPYEQRWLDNVEKWQDDYCAAWEKEKDDMFKLVKAIELAQKHPDSKDESLFKYLSRFEQTVTCDGASKTRTTWIEPLAGPLRHPFSICKLVNGHDIYYLLRTYIILESARDLPDEAYGPTWFFDLGASLYDAGPGGASQRYFVEEYAKNKLEFDGMWLWEPSAGANVFSTANYDDKIAYKYHYFTTFASTNPKSGFSPYYIMKKVAKPEDYVVYKLDIDTVEVESELVKQMMEDPQLVSLVDEFFFEHHVNFKGMIGWWAGVWDRNVTLAGSYQMFLKLRKMGIRAHPWP